MKAGGSGSQVSVVKAIASALGIGTGGSVGREGPIVQIGSCVGQTIGQWIKMPKQHADPARLRRQRGHRRHRQRPHHRRSSMSRSSCSVLHHALSPPCLPRRSPTSPPSRAGATSRSCPCSRPASNCTTPATTCCLTLDVVVLGSHSLHSWFRRGFDRCGRHPIPVTGDVLAFACPLYVGTRWPERFSARRVPRVGLLSLLRSPDAAAATSATRRVARAVLSRLCVALGGCETFCALAQVRADPGGVPVGSEPYSPLSMPGVFVLILLMRRSSSSSILSPALRAHHLHHQAAARAPHHRTTPRPSTYPTPCGPSPAAPVPAPLLRATTTPAPPHLPPPLLPPIQEPGPVDELHGCSRAVRYAARYQAGSRPTAAAIAPDHHPQPNPQPSHPYDHATRHTATAPATPLRGYLFAEITVTPILAPGGDRPPHLAAGSTPVSVLPAASSTRPTRRSPSPGDRVSLLIVRPTARQTPSRLKPRLAAATAAAFACRRLAP